MKSFPFQLKIGALDKFSSTFANVGKDLDRIGHKAKNIGKSITIGLSAPIAAFGGLAVKTTADFETLRVSLHTATGGAKEGAAAFAELQKFAATTPFQLEEVVTAFIKLKNRGLDPSKRAMVAYGNTAGAMGKSLDQMIEAVADASTLEFERLKEFGIKANQQGDKVTFTFRGVKTTVQKDSKAIEEYLMRIGEVDFAGGMEMQAATLKGAFSNMQDSISNALDIIGQDIGKTLDLSEKVRTFSSEIDKLTKVFVGLPAPLKDSVINFGLLAALAGPVIYGVGQIVIGMGLIVALLPQIIAGFGMILVAAPWLLLAGIVGGIIYQFSQLIENVGGVKNAIMLLGTVVLDALLTPFRVFAELVLQIWGLLGNPPTALKDFARGSHTRDLANLMHTENAGAADAARSVLNNHSNTYELQNRALKGDKAAIEVLFKNPPAGMKTNITTQTNANVSVEQGISMGGGY